MRSNQKASIILITHNRLDYTRYCLNSILTKTIYRPFELIVVDNNSTDGTMPYLKRFERDGKIQKLILLKKNHGAGYALNVGIRLAQGYYLIRSDNDMIYNQGWLTALVKALQRIPRAVLQVAVYAELLPDGQQAGFSPVGQVNGVIVKRGPIGGCNMAFTRAAYAEIGPFPEDLYAEDGVFCHRALQKGYVVGQINDATGTHIDDPRCPLSKRYTDYAEYRIGILRNLQKAGVRFVCEEDQRFYEAYVKNRGEKF